MSSPIHGMISGTFTTDANASTVLLPLPCGYDFIEIINETDYLAHAAARIIAKGFAAAPAHSAIVSTGSGANPNVLTETIWITAGFTFLPDSGTMVPGAPVAVTGVSDANPAVVTSASTAMPGDIVRLYNLTGGGVGMAQASGIDFTVTATNPGVTQTLGFLNSAAFADTATAGSIEIIPSAGRWYPRRRTITNITATNPAVISLSVLHDFVVGEKVRIMVPPIPGNPATQTMTQMNGLLGTITAVANTLGVNTNTITVDIDASTFTAFRWATSTEAHAGWTPAQVIPVGEAATVPYANLLDDAETNKSFIGVKIDSGILVASKTYSYIARKGAAI